MLRAPLALVALILQACVLTQQAIVRNDTGSALVVSVQQERKDLGWARKEDKSVPVSPHTICSIRHDIFYDTFLYIENTATGLSTNINALKGERYVYAVSETESRQVVTITEADSKTSRLFDKSTDQCVKEEPGDAPDS